jgi:hypothetical protein
MSSLRGGDPDHQRCDNDDADGVGGEPMLPTDQHFRRRAGIPPVRHGAANAGDGGADDRRDKKADHLTQPIEAEVRAEIIFDQPGRDQRFRGVAQA